MHSKSSHEYPVSVSQEYIPSANFYIGERQVNARLEVVAKCCRAAFIWRPTALLTCGVFRGTSIMMHSAWVQDARTTDCRSLG